MDEKPTSLVALRDGRERVIAVLSDAFAQDLLEVDVFEHRLDLAHRARTLGELEALTADLPAPAEPAAGAAPTQALAVRPPQQVALTQQAPERRKIINVLSGTERRGSWVVPRHLRVVSVLGGTKLDFREAVFAGGVSEVSIFSLLGGTEILVPPGLAVEMEGSGVLSGFEHLSRSSAAPDPDAPLLRISGFAILGGVTVETRLPGESSRESRRRLRAERRAERRALRHGGRELRALPEGRSGGAGEPEGGGDGRG